MKPDRTRYDDFDINIGRRRSDRMGQAIVVALSFLVAGCGGQEPARVAAPVVELGQIVSWDRTFPLDESDAVINVTPAVTFDSWEGFLVADVSEHQLRRYSPFGELHWTSGRRGDGPGEFQQPSRAVRLPTGEILVTNFDRRFTILSSSGDSVLRMVETPFTRIEDVDIVDDSLVMVSAILDRDFTSPRLHLWDTQNDRRLRSFFEPFEATPNQTAASVASWTMAAIRGDTVAAIFSVSDSVYLYTIAGDRLVAHPLPSRHFRAVPETAPDPNVDPRQRAQWLGSFDYMSDVHWLSNGDLLILYKRLLPSEALSSEWHMVVMSPQGEGIYEVREVPRLLAVKSDSGNDELIFVSPDAEVPNQWANASLLPY